MKRLTEVAGQKYRIFDGNSNDHNIGDCKSTLIIDNLDLDLLLTTRE